MPDSDDPRLTFDQALVDMHNSYRQQRTAHEKPDELISDVVTPQTLRPHIARAAFFFIAIFALFITWIILLILTLASSSLFSREQSESTNTLSTLNDAVLTLIVVAAIAWIVSLLVPVREPIAEYRVLIERRSTASAIAYTWIVKTFAARQLRHLVINLARTRNVPVLTVANLEGLERGLIIVRPMGADLYVEWSMWRNRSTVRLAGHLVRDMLNRTQSAVPKSIVRASSAAAMREELHSVTREGVQAAILQPPVTKDEALEQVQSLPDLDDWVGETFRPQSWRSNGSGTQRRQSEY